MDAEARRDAARARNAKAKVSQGCVKVVVVELADWQARHFGSRAALLPVAFGVGRFSTSIKRLGE